MIKESMFFTEPTIKDYREISLPKVVEEFLLCKGTRKHDGTAINQKVKPKDLCSSALFVYGLKDNATNKAAVVYYCERQARRSDSMDGDFIKIPSEFWEKCDRKNKEFTHGNDRKEVDDACRTE